MPGPTRRPPSWLRCSSASPAGGSAGAPSRRSPTPRRPGRASASARASARSRAWAPRGAGGVGRVRARKVGPRLFVDLDIAASRTLPLDRVMALKAEVTRALAAAMPETELNAVVSPRALDDETVLERVMVIARNRALAVHHVTVHAIGGRLAV